MGSRMHAGEVELDASLVQALIAQQFPQWGELPVSRVQSAGTDNAMFRLGEKLAARLPRIDWAAGQIDKEWQWLLQLERYLPVPIPVPLAKGAPGIGYAWEWSVCPWLPGTNPVAEQRDETQIATGVAGFARALWKIGPAGGPRATSTYQRGVPLELRDTITRTAISQLDGMQLVDTTAVLAAWESALTAAPYEGEPVWIHGDLQAGNLLVQNGKLSGVIDFGCMGLGDPAVDCLVAWNFFSAPARAIFREALEVDEATWVRGRGWALSVALLALPYYKDTNPELAGTAQYTISQVLAET